MLPYNDDVFLMSIKFASKWHITLHEYRSGSLFDLSLKSNELKSGVIFSFSKSLLNSALDQVCHSRQFSRKFIIMLPYNDDVFLMSMKFASK